MAPAVPQNAPEAHQHDTIDEDDFISPSNDDLLLMDIGRNLILESISTSRDFAKFMIGTSIGAVPVYLGILKWSASDIDSIHLFLYTLFILPVVLFLVATSYFVHSYKPITTTMSLDDPESIQIAFGKISETRTSAMTSGSLAFYAAIVLASIAIVAAL